MTTAIVLSGGGAKGDFEVGALRYIYDQGVRPDIICGVSVGAINAIKLAEGEGDAQQGLAGLEGIWKSLKYDTDMYVEEAWLHDPDMDSRVRDILTGRASDLDISLPPELPQWGDIGLLISLVSKFSFLVTDGASLLKSLNVIATKARALYNLDPIRAKLNAQIDLNRVNAWAANHKLRLGMVSLESGGLRWMTETGQVLERDGSPVYVRNALPAACQALADQIANITLTISNLQAELQQAAPNEKAALVGQIREATTQKNQLKAQYDACVQSQPATIPLQGDRKLGVLASAAMPGIFLPIVIGGESYVDGGVREVLPLQHAIDLGADLLYAISASPAAVTPTTSNFKDAKMVSIVARSIMNIMVNEVAQSDELVHPRVTGQSLPPIKYIKPDFEVHDTTVIDPGLIQINRDYGYMRASDVYGSVDPQSRRWKIATEIATLRVQIWDLENHRYGQADSRSPGVPTPAANPDLQGEIDAKKGQLRNLINERRSLGGPMAAGIDVWGVALELHRWVINAARFASQVVPSGITAGSSTQVSVTMTNSGNTVWTAGAGYNLGSQSPQDNSNWGSTRRSLPADIYPGGNATFTFTISSPASLARDFQWRMVQDGVEWFGDYSPKVSISRLEPAQCAVYRSDIRNMQTAITNLQTQLQHAAPNEKAEIIGEIQELQSQLSVLKQEAQALGCSGI